MGAVFRLSARYSGRISFGLYILMFYFFIAEKTTNLPLNKTRNFGILFGVLHLIHFGFLAGSVIINQLPLIPVKLTGGFLAYMAIIIYPFYLQKIKKMGIHLFYFYYVGFVMAMTFLARIKGEFVGASPSLFHYFGISLVLLFFLFGAIRLYKAAKFKVR